MFQSTVVSFSFKKDRFEKLHAVAMRWPSDQFLFIGIDPDSSTGFDLESSLKGELENSALPFKSDPYGCHTSLRKKRKDRNPFSRTPPYYQTCPELKELMNFCGPALIPTSRVPWWNRLNTCLLFDDQVCVCACYSDECLITVTCINWNTFQVKWKVSQKNDKFYHYFRVFFFTSSLVISFRDFSCRGYLSDSNNVAFVATSGTPLLQPILVLIISISVRFLNTSDPDAVFFIR